MSNSVNQEQIAPIVRFISVCLDTEASWNIETLRVARKAIIHVLPRKGEANALTRLRGSAGWSAPWFFAKNSQVFSRRGPCDDVVVI